MSKLDPHGLQQLLLGKWICSSKLENLPGLSLARWEACHVFSFTRPKETYFGGVRVKEGGGGGEAKFSSLPLLASLPVSYPTHFDLLQRLDFFGIEHGGYSSRNIRSACGRVFLSKLLSNPLPSPGPNRLPLRPRGCDTHLIVAIKLVSTESIK